MNDIVNRHADYLTTTAGVKLDGTFSTQEKQEMNKRMKNLEWLDQGKQKLYGAAMMKALKQITKSSDNTDISTMIAGFRSQSGDMYEKYAQGKLNNDHIALMQLYTRIENIVQWKSGKKLDIDGLLGPITYNFITGLEYAPTSPAAVKAKLEKLFQKFDPKFREARANSIINKKSTFDYTTPPKEKDEDEEKDIPKKDENEKTTTYTRGIKADGTYRVTGDTTKVGKLWESATLKQSAQEEKETKELQSWIEHLKQVSSLSSAYLKYLETYNADSSKFKPLIAQLKQDMLDFQYNVIAKIGDGSTKEQQSTLKTVQLKNRATKLFPDHTQSRASWDGASALTTSYDYTDVSWTRQTVRWKKTIISSLITDMQAQISSGKRKDKDLRDFFAKRLRSIDENDGDGGITFASHYTSGEAIKDVTQDDVQQQLTNHKNKEFKIDTKNSPQEKIAKSMNFIQESMNPENSKGYGSKLRDIFANNKKPTPAELTAILDGYVDAWYIDLPKSNGDDSADNRSPGHDFDTDDLAGDILRGYEQIKKIDETSMQTDFKKQKEALWKLAEQSETVQKQIAVCDEYIKAKPGTAERKKLTELAEQTRMASVMSIFENRATEFVLEKNAAALTQHDKDWTVWRYLDIEGIGSRRSDASHNFTQAMVGSVIEEVGTSIIIGALLASWVGTVWWAALLAAKLWKIWSKALKFAKFTKTSEKLAKGAKILDKGVDAMRYVAKTPTTRLGELWEKWRRLWWNVINAAAMKTGISSSLELAKTWNVEEAGKKFYQQALTREWRQNHISLWASISIMTAMNKITQIRALEQTASGMTWPNLTAMKFAFEETGCFLTDSALELFSKDGLTNQEIAMNLLAITTLGYLTRDKIKFDIVEGKPTFNGLDHTQVEILLDDIKTGKVQVWTPSYQQKMQELKAEQKKPETNTETLAKEDWSDGQTNKDWNNKQWEFKQEQNIEETNVQDDLATLWLSEWASLSDLKKAYRALAKKYHPDMTKTTDKDKFVEIDQAYERLSKILWNKSLWSETTVWKPWNETQDWTKLLSESDLKSETWVVNTWKQVEAETKPETKFDDQISELTKKMDKTGSNSPWTQWYFDLLKERTELYEQKAILLLNQVWERIKKWFLSKLNLNDHKDKAIFNFMNAERPMHLIVHPQVRAMQEQLGIKVDGFLWPITYKKLEERVESKQIKQDFKPEIATTKLPASASESAPQPKMLTENDISGVEEGQIFDVVITRNGKQETITVQAQAKGDPDWTTSFQIVGTESDFPVFADQFGWAKRETTLKTKQSDGNRKPEYISIKGFYRKWTESPSTKPDAKPEAKISDTESTIKLEWEEKTLKEAETDAKDIKATIEDLSKLDISDNFKRREKRSNAMDKIQSLLNKLPKLPTIKLPNVKKFISDVFNLLKKLWTRKQKEIWNKLDQAPKTGKEYEQRLKDMEKEINAAFNKFDNPPKLQEWAAKQFKEVDLQGKIKMKEDDANTLAVDQKFLIKTTDGQILEVTCTSTDPAGVGIHTFKTADGSTFPVMNDQLWGITMKDGKPLWNNRETNLRNAKGDPIKGIKINGFYKYESSRSDLGNVSSRSGPDAEASPNLKEIASTNPALRRQMEERLAIDARSPEWPDKLAAKMDEINQDIATSWLKSVDKASDKIRETLPIILANQLKKIKNLTQAWRDNLTNKLATLMLTLYLTFAPISAKTLNTWKPDTKAKTEELMKPLQESMPPNIYKELTQTVDEAVSISQQPRETINWEKISTSWSLQKYTNSYIKITNDQGIASYYQVESVNNGNITMKNILDPTEVQVHNKKSIKSFKNPIQTSSSVSQ